MHATAMAWAKCVSCTPEEAERGGEGVFRCVTTNEQLLDDQRDAGRPEGRQLLVVTVEVHQATCEQQLT